MQKQKETHTSVALYARVSSDKQDVDLSVAAQLRALRDHAAKNGYVVVAEYIDEAESGRLATRPQFREMIDEATGPKAPFREILVWKFSRFTRKREHAVAFKSMLRRKGVRVVSITEHADDSPTGKLMEAIIESVDEFYSENLGQEVLRGMRESASRGFWVSPRTPFGYKRVRVEDGPKTRVKLELDPMSSVVVRRMFDLFLSGRTLLEIAQLLNDEGVRTPRGAQWANSGVHRILTTETYAGTLNWGVHSKSNIESVHLPNAIPAIITEAEYRHVQVTLAGRAPSVVHPRRISSPFLLSGLAICAACGKPMTGTHAKSGKYTYYVCQTIIKNGSAGCDSPRLRSDHFEKLIIEELRTNVLTEKNIRHLVIMLDEEMDGEANLLRKKLHAADRELGEVGRKLKKIYEAIEDSDIELADVAPRIREHRQRQQELEATIDESREELARRRRILDRVDTIAAYAKDMGDFLRGGRITQSKAFVRSFVKDIQVSADRAVINYTVPMPEDSPIGTSTKHVVDWKKPVRSTIPHGSAYGIRTRDLRLERAVSLATRRTRHTTERPPSV